MKIRQLRIRNFRGLREVDLRDLPRGVFFTGPTGAGKSSILQAVQMVFFGRIADQAGDMPEMAELIGPVGKDAAIQLVIEWDTDTYTELIIKPKGSTLTIGKLQGNPRDVRKQFWEKLEGPTMGQAECAANPRKYLIGDIGPLLAELASPSITMDLLCSMAGEHAEWLRQWLTNREYPDVLEAANLNVIGGDVEKARAKVYAEIKRLETETEPLRGLAAPVDRNGNPIPWQEAPTLNRLIDDLSAERDELLMERGRASKPAVETDGRSVEAIEKSIEQLTAEVDSARKALQEAEQNHRRTQAAITQATRQESDLRGQIALRNRTLSTAPVEEWGVCPTCGQKITKATLAKLRKENVDRVEVQSEIDKLEEQRALAEESLETAKEAEVKTAAAVEETRNAYGEALGKLNLEQHALAAAKEIAERETQRPIEEIDAELADIESRLTAAKSAMQVLQKLERLATADDELETLRAEKNHLEWAVTAFRDGAILKALGSDGRKDYVARANQTLTQFGYQLDVAVNGKECTVLMGRAGQRMIPVCQVSEGEFVLAQAAVAFGWNTGTPLLIDGLDKLDGGLKGDIFQVLSERLTNGETQESIWLAGAYGLGGDPDLDALAGALDPFALVWVENGTARIVRPAEVAA